MMHCACEVHRYASLMSFVSLLGELALAVLRSETRPC